MDGGIHTLCAVIRLLFISHPHKRSLYECRRVDEPFCRVRIKCVPETFISSRPMRWPTEMQDNATSMEDIHTFRIIIHASTFVSQPTGKQVVYLSDNSGYIPVTSLRTGGGRPGNGISSSGGGGGGTIIGTGPAAVGVDLEAWRTDLWDRDYTTSRHRHNSTRVQRT